MQPRHTLRALHGGAKRDRVKNYCANREHQIKSYACNIQHHHYHFHQIAVHVQQFMDRPVARWVLSQAVIDH